MKKQLSDFLRHLSIMAIICMLPSCFQNETTLHLKKDGSGTIVEKMTFSAEMIEMMAQFTQPGGPDPIAELLSQEKAIEKAASFGDGVTFEKMVMLKEEGREGAQAFYTFTDINTLTLSPGEAVSDMNQAAPNAPKAPREPSDTVRFTYDDGELTIKTPQTEYKGLDMVGESAQDPQLQGPMKEMLDDMRVTFNLVIEPGISKTNASHVEENIITLFDVQIGKMIAQTELLEEISEIAKTDEVAATQKFSKVDGVKIETQDQVSVTLK